MLPRCFASCSESISVCHKAQPVLCRWIFIGLSSLYIVMFLLVRDLNRVVVIQGCLMSFLILLRNSQLLPAILPDHNYRPYLRKIFTLQPTRFTPSSSGLTLSEPPVTYHLMFSNRAISISARFTPRLWNDLLPELRTFSLPPPSSLPITNHYLHQPPLSMTHQN